MPADALRGLLLVLVAGWLALAAPAWARRADEGGEVTVAVDQLPKEAQQALARIKAGGPFPYARDGIVFGNYEGRLPARPRGTYHEYTVKTPGKRNRGTRRIITGDGEFYYTDDHYETFRRILE
jgi:ribonuclease T1